MDDGGAVGVEGASDQLGEIGVGGGAYAVRTHGHREGGEVRRAKIHLMGAIPRAAS